MKYKVGDYIRSIEQGKVVIGKIVDYRIDKLGYNIPKEEYKIIWSDKEFGDSMYMWYEVCMVDEHCTLATKTEIVLFGKKGEYEI